LRRWLRCWRRALSIATLAASRLSALAPGDLLPARARSALTGLAVLVWMPASGLYLALATVAFWIALASWLAVTAGLLRQGARWLADRSIARRRTGHDRLA
jgi:hypothetical protein